jgi:endonuclease/exonuclease/phosphatase family metal-dependent hydrolase
MKSLSARCRAAGAVIAILGLGGCRSVPLDSLHQDDGGLLVATFNVHYLSPRADSMSWTRREAAVLRVLGDINADLIAFQEMETFAGSRFNDENVQLESVRAAFPEYGVAATGDPRHYPSTQPVLYRKDMLEHIDQGFFFFSPAPDEVYSRPWHKRFPAFASWARFRILSDGTTFRVFNIHTDSSSPRNRMKTARLVAQRIAEREHPDEPVILMGDFNAPASFPSLRIYQRAGFALPSGRSSTFHFNRGLHLFPAIDHVLAQSGFTVSSISVVRRQYDGVWPSDHYPVAARVQLE